MKRRGSLALLLIAAVVLLRPWEDEAVRSLAPGGSTEDRPGASEKLSGRVIRAVDGDTLEVAIDGGEVETVRLIGVDTPETVKPDTPVQCFGPRASAFEHEHVEGRRVRLLVGVEPRDAYGRLLAYVWLRGRSIEEVLLRRGLARRSPSIRTTASRTSSKALSKQRRRLAKGSGMRAERFFPAIGPVLAERLCKILCYGPRCPFGASPL